MSLLLLLDQIRARNRFESALAYANSPEAAAAAVELDRLRAACAEAEANYLATCAKHDAERKAEGRG